MQLNNKYSYDIIEKTYAEMYINCDASIAAYIQPAVKQSNLRFLIASLEQLIGLSFSVEH